MSEPNSSPDFKPGEQKDEHDELLAELEAALEHGRLLEITPEQRQWLRQYVVEHEGEIEWLREQCSKLKNGLMSAEEAQNWFDAFVVMESDSSQEGE